MVFVYNLHDLSLIKTYDLPLEIKEGWGITHDNDYLYISEGSNKIFVVKPEENELKVVRVIETE